MAGNGCGDAERPRIDHLNPNKCLSCAPKMVFEALSAPVAGFYRFNDKREVLFLRIVKMGVPGGI